MSFGKIVLALLFLVGSAGMAYAATAAYLGPTIVVADMRDVVHDEGSGTVVRSSSGACVRTQWMTDSDECSGPLVMREKTARTLSREERTVYFGFNLASLSPEMKQKLDTLANIMTSSSNVKGARIVGYADRIGNAKYNEKLSKKRAEGVKNYLIARGLINTNVAETRWFGASEPSTSCPDGLSRAELINCLQPDRRVEVEIDFAPDNQASR